MKAYIAITGLVFALLTIAHLVRVATESTRVLSDPVFVVFTILPAALAIWAVILLRRLSR
ncbi:MAG TPA: hypothetical protein VFZ71_13150 [Pyrinomonadaceae bacterium]